MVGTLHRLREIGRRDILQAIASRRISLPEAHDLHNRNFAALEDRLRRSKEDLLGDLVREWLAWLKCPGVIAPRTRRPYAPKTIERYVYNWDAFFDALPTGRQASVHDITKGFIADFRRVGRLRPLA